MGERRMEKSGLLPFIQRKRSLKVFYYDGSGEC